MAEDSENERIRISFQRVKEDITSLKESLENEKKELKDINSKINEIYSFIGEIKENLNIFKKSSKGNEGVINDHQQSTTTIINAQQSTTSNLDLSLKELSRGLTSVFQSLTDREFSVFVSIFELEKQLPEVTYTDLANKLAISEPTIRNTVNRLISKKVPLQKIRFFNKKVSLSLSKELHDISLITKLVKIHQNPNNQKTLLDM